MPDYWTVPIRHSDVARLSSARSLTTAVIPSETGSASRSASSSQCSGTSSLAVVPAVPQLHVLAQVRRRCRVRGRTSAHTRTRFQGSLSTHSETRTKVHQSTGNWTDASRVAAIGRYASLVEPAFRPRGKGSRHYLRHVYVRRAAGDNHAGFALAISYQLSGVSFQPEIRIPDS